MGSPDLTRAAAALVCRVRIVLLLVVATLIAELADLAVVAHAERAQLAAPEGAELVSCLVGLGAAGLLGLWLGGAGRLDRGRGVRLTGALLAALVAHELTALGLDAEHGAGVWDVAAHVGGSVLPVALVLGGLLALVVGTQAVRRAVLHSVPGRPLVVAVAPAAVRVSPSRDSSTTGLLASLRVAGRAPPPLPG